MERCLGEQNQKEHPPPEGQAAKIEGATFWTSRFWYEHEKARHRRKVASLNANWSKSGELGGKPKELEAQVALFMEDDLPGGKAQPSDAVAVSEDAAGHRRAKRLSALMDNLSALIGKGFGLLLRQPDQGKRDVLSNLEKEASGLYILIPPGAPIDQGDYSAWEDQIREIQARLWEQFPMLKPKGKEPKKTVQADIADMLRVVSQPAAGQGSQS